MSDIKQTNLNLCEGHNICTWCGGQICIAHFTRQPVCEIEQIASFTRQHVHPNLHINVDCIKRDSLLIACTLCNVYKLEISHVFGYNSLRTHGLLALGKQHPIESRFVAAVHLHRERHPTLTKSRIEFQVYNKTRVDHPGFA